MVVTQNSATQQHVQGLLQSAGTSLDCVHFVQVPVRSKWIRDYGPVAIKTVNRDWALLDADYFDNSLLAISPHEDRLPTLLAQRLGLQSIRVPLGIQHGNLLSNGQGLYVTTRKLLEDNAARGYDAKSVDQVLKRYYGAKEVVLLDNLIGEPTGHVDMFATFTSANTIVVGSFELRDDPENAAILDRNAAHLAATFTADGPLRVVRIPMPRKRRSGAGPLLWATYTNVTYANQILLVPVCQGSNADEANAAINVYRQLLPDWRIVRIDATPLMQQFGSLRCATMNLGSVGALRLASSRGSGERVSAREQQTFSFRGMP